VKWTVQSSQSVISSKARDVLFIRRGLAFCVIALALAISLDAQAPEPAKLPGEPHHHLKIDNEFVRVYYVEVPPHEATQLHQHDHDYVYVSLGPAEVINAVLDQPETHLVLKDGETHFTRGGFAHVARNQSDTPFRNITIELLKSQREPRNLCAQVVSSAPLGPCDKRSMEGYSREPQFENEGMRGVVVGLGPKAKREETATKIAFLAVGLGDSRIKVSAKGKPKMILEEGEAAWFDVGSNVQFSNEKKQPASFLEITFRDAPAPPKH